MNSEIASIICKTLALNDAKMTYSLLALCSDTYNNLYLQSLWTTYKKSLFIEANTVRMLELETNGSKYLKLKCCRVGKSAQLFLLFSNIDGDEEITFTLPKIFESENPSNLGCSLALIWEKDVMIIKANALIEGRKLTIRYPEERAHLMESLLIYDAKYNF